MGGKWEGGGRGWGRGGVGGERGWGEGEESKSWSSVVASQAADQKLQLVM